MVNWIKELNFPKGFTIGSAEVNLPFMDEESITTTIKVDKAITPDFSHDLEVEFLGTKYIMPLREPQGSVDSESWKSSHELTFQNWVTYQMKRWYFFTVQGESGVIVPDKYDASTMMNLGDLCNLFSKVLRFYYDDTITLQLNPDWVYKKDTVSVSISHTKVWEVLTKFKELFDVHWQIYPNGDNEHYVIKVGYPIIELDHIFEYGFSGGLLSLERQVQSDKIVNMLIGRGGETNLPLRYYKNIDEKNPDFRADPDWVTELKDLYFDRLRGATFRSYIQGWKAARHDKDGLYPEYTPTDRDTSYAPWAWQKGYDDVTFDPVEYVADEFVLAPDAKDVKIQINPTSFLYAKHNSSLGKYGPLMDGAADNDDIYPTIQGTGLDIAVDVEQITEDEDVVADNENSTQISNIGGASGSVWVDKQGRATMNIMGGYFEVPEGMTANLNIDLRIVSALNEKGRNFDVDTSAEIEKVSLSVASMDGTAGGSATGVTSDKVNFSTSASGLPSGKYIYQLDVTVHNLTTDTKLSIVVATSKQELTSANISSRKSGVFDVWVKNIWSSEKLSTENDIQYSERVWKPILGNKEGGSGSVSFTTGQLAVSEDYSFTIVDYPTYDPSKTYIDEDGEEHQSHWRLTLARSDADLETLGMYVPNKTRNGKAGDKFVFTGTEMTHDYTLWAEKALDDSKKDSLNEVKEVDSTLVVKTDRVRLNDAGSADALIHKLVVGGSVRIADSRFITTINDDNEVVPSSPVTRYIQSIKYSFREPSESDAALNPDVELTLSNEFTETGDAISEIQSEVSSLQKQIGSLSNIERYVRAVGNKLYLRKDGLEDRSYSPTKFCSLLTSGDFRNGLIDGKGWGFYRDANNNWVFEIDRIAARQDLQVTTLVVNQAEARCGMEIDTAAAITVTKVVESSIGYLCYFDTKQGSVANLFKKDDIGYCQRWTAENNKLKFYKRRISYLGPDFICLTNNTNYVNGDDIPEVGDVIIHYGNYNDKNRQFIKVRDIIGGGYERYIEGLDSVTAAGTEFFFVGKQAGMYGDAFRFFIGDENGYIEYINRKLVVLGELSIKSTIGDKTIDNFVGDIAQNAADKVREEMKDNIQTLQNQIDGVVESWSYAYTPTTSNYPASEWKTDAQKAAHVGDVFFNIEPFENEDGTFNDNAGKAWRWSQEDSEHKGYHWHLIADSDAIKALQLAQMSVLDTDVYFISSTSNTTAPALPTTDSQGYITNLYGWSTVAPAWSENKYIWQTTYVRKGNGTASFSKATCIQGAKGAMGVGIDRIVEEYYLSSSPDELIGGEWSEERPDWIAGYYYWTRSHIYYTDGTDETIGEICVTGDIQVSGVNLALKSRTYTRGTSAILGNYELTEQIAINQYYTATIWGSLGNGFTDFTLYLGDNKDVTLCKIAKVSAGVYRAVFKLQLGYLADVNGKRVQIYANRNASSTTAVTANIVERFKLEKGNMGTDWSPAPQDFDYLTAALQEDTSVSGGLIQTSLIKLGYTQSDGTRKTMSGTSGLYNAGEPGGGLAFWAGGDNIDAEKQGLTDEEKNEQATFAMRMDGTGYFAGKVIRFTKDSIEVGDNVILDADGLKMATESGNKLAITNSSIDVANNIDKQSAPITIANNATLNLVVPSSLLSQPARIRSFAMQNVSLNNGGVINKGATITGKMTASFTNSSINELLGTFVVRIINGNNEIVKEYTTSIVKNDSTFVSTININYIIPSEDAYKLQFGYIPNGSGVTGTLTNVAASMVCNGLIAFSTSEQTMLGNDGFITVWGNSVMLAKNNDLMMRCGNYGFRVTNDGIYRMQGDGVWTLWK